MRIVLLFLMLFTTLTYAMGQQKVLLKGQITDKENDAPLIGATVISMEFPNMGTTTDTLGAFSLSLPTGKHTIVCTYIGYKKIEKTVNLNKAVTALSLSMSTDAQRLNEVTVTSRSATSHIREVQIGVEKLEMEQLAMTPALFGEKDIMRSIQLLPGVKSEGDGSCGFQVRGGTSAQNLILLDDATIFNAGHLMGLFSAFNDDALASVSLYKGLIPAQYGEATSAVLDISSKTGDMNRYHGDASIGLLSAKVNFEGPIAKDKASFFVSARRSYLDLFLKASDEYKDNVLNFYDINAKVSYNISERNKLFASFYMGKDNLGLSELMEMKWGNTSLTLRWFHQFANDSYLQTSLIGSHFYTKAGVEMMHIDESFKSFIDKVGIKEAFTFHLPKQEFKTGLQLMLIDLQSAEWKVYNLREREQRKAVEGSVWINDEWKPTERYTLSAGVRLSLFSALGGSPYYEIDNDGNITQTYNYGSSKLVKLYALLEPRISMNYKITEEQSIKLGYSRTSQNIHALRNQTTSTPFDRYAFSSNLVKPQIADQVSMGYVLLSKDHQYEFSLEGYYKAVQNVQDYKDGKTYGSEIELERLILSGKGRAYGAEFCARKNTGKLTGWISYTLSWSENKIDGINNNKWYTANNDRRHDISVVGIYQLNRKWNFSATWKYNTGQALTAPSAKYTLNNETVYYYAERNGYRAPAYHRLDLSATYTRTKEKYTDEWVFGIYNAYCRYNPYLIHFDDDDTKASGTKVTMIAMFGLIPSVSYHIKF